MGCCDTLNNGQQRLNAGPNKGNDTNIINNTNKNNIKKVFDNTYNNKINQNNGEVGEKNLTNPQTNNLGNNDITEIKNSLNSSNNQIKLK